LYAAGEFTNAWQEMEVTVFIVGEEELSNVFTKYFGIWRGRCGNVSSIDDRKGWQFDVCMYSTVLTYIKKQKEGL
jgi:hypothetical protein